MHQLIHVPALAAARRAAGIGMQHHEQRCRVVDIGLRGPDRTADIVDRIQRQAADLSRARRDRCVGEFETIDVRVTVGARCVVQQRVRAVDAVTTLELFFVSCFERPATPTACWLAGVRVTKIGVDDNWSDGITNRPVSPPLLEVATKGK